MKRILVRAPNWIGDQVMAYAFYSQLRKDHPQAWIGVVCTEWVKDIQFRGYVDEVFILPKFKKKSLWNSYQSIRRIAAELRDKGPWDLGYLLPNSFGSAFLFYLAKVKAIRGYQTDLRGYFLTEKVKWNPDPMIHRADTYFNLVLSGGSEFDSAKEYFTKFDPFKQWPEVIPQEIPRERYVVIAPGATADSRRWSAQNFSDLIKNIEIKYGYKSVIVGGTAEKSIAEEFIQKNIPILDYTGKGSVSSLWKLFQNSQFVICNESGLAHVASLCGAKVFIVCGAADPKRTKPVGPGSVKVITNSSVDCWPCEKNVCQFQDQRMNQCHEGILPSRVMTEIYGELNV